MNVLHSTVSIKIAFFICWVKDLNSYTINNAKLPFLFPFAKTKTATNLRQRIANHIPLLVVVVRFGLDYKNGDALVVDVVDDAVIGSDVA